MLADVAKGQTAIISTGKKEAGIAFKNSLMKKVCVQTLFMSTHRV